MYSSESTNTVNFGEQGKPKLSRPTVIASIVLVSVIAISYHFDKLSERDLWFIVLLAPAVILHEISHGFMALRFGDTTAKAAGRLSFNPARHIDPIGTVVLPLLLIFSGAGFVFGWARPVPVNTFGMSSFQKLLVGIVGPGTNIFLAAVASALLATVHTSAGSNADAWVVQVALGLIIFVQLNVFLAVFNMFPIPPLDGSAVVDWILPKELQGIWESIKPYGFIILLVLIMTNMLPIAEIARPIYEGFIELALAL